MASNKFYDNPLSNDIIKNMSSDEWYDLLISHKQYISRVPSYIKQQFTIYQVFKLIMMNIVPIKGEYWYDISKFNKNQWITMLTTDYVNCFIEMIPDDILSIFDNDDWYKIIMFDHLPLQNKVSIKYIRSVLFTKEQYYDLLKSTYFNIDYIPQNIINEFSNNELKEILEIFINEGVYDKSINKIKDILNINNR